MVFTYVQIGERVKQLDWLCPKYRAADNYYVLDKLIEKLWLNLQTAGGDGLWDLVVPDCQSDMQRFSIFPEKNQILTFEKAYLLRYEREINLSSVDRSQNVVVHQFVAFEAVAAKSADVNP